MTTPTAEPPSLTVLLLAYHPRPYLAEALASVLAQTPQAGRFEVRVVTGYEEADLPRGPEGRPVLGAVDPEPRLGRWLLGAVRSVRSELIAFLEDDDLFEPDHVARARSCFAGRPPGPSYYRSRLSVIDSGGTVLPRSAWSRLEIDAPLRLGPLEVPPKSGDAGVGRLRRANVGWLNLSTVVVRKEVFTPEVGAAIAECGSPDLCVFVAGVLSGGGLYFDDRRTTRYRHYGGSLSRSLEWRRQHAADHLRLADLATAHGAGALAEWLRSRGEALGRAVRAGELVRGIRTGVPRPALRSLWEEYLHALGRDPLLSPPVAARWGSVGLGAAGLLAPGTTRKALAWLDRAFDMP